MTVPANGADPEPDAGRVVRLRRPADASPARCPGEKFSNGDALTSSDVKYRFERTIEIADPNGSSVLLGSISNGDTDKPRPWPTAPSRRRTTPTVVFHLEPARHDVHADPDLPGHGVDRRRGRLPGRQEAGRRRHGSIGSGPYKLSQYKAGEQAVLEVNRDYTGTKTPQSRAGLRQVLSATRRRSRRPSRTARSTSPGARLSPTDLNVPREGRQGRRASAARARRSATGSGSCRQPRSARSWRSARPRPRSSTARPSPKNAYDGTVDPAVLDRAARASAARRTPSRTKYGEPDVAEAKQILDDGRHQDAGRPSRWATRPTHYGPNAVDEANELAAPAERQRPVQGHAEERRVGAVPDDLQAGRLRPVHPRLVPRLPGRRRLPVAVHASTVASSRTATPTPRSTSWSPRSRARPTRPSATSRLRSAAGHRRPRTSRSSRRGSARTSPCTATGDDGRRGHARPGVHLPVLDDQQERLSHTLTAHGSWGGRPPGAVSPRSSTAVDRRRHAS